MSAGGRRTVLVVLLRCTTRLLKLLGNRSGVLVDADPGGDDWYANVFNIERRKCLLIGALPLGVESSGRLFL